MITKEQLENNMINEEALQTFDFNGLIDDKDLEAKLYDILKQKETIAYFAGAKAALKITINNFIDNMFA